MTTMIVVFQSSPGTLAGRYVKNYGSLPFHSGFNPRPALWPGATRYLMDAARIAIVSILARHSGRALPGTAGSSSPGR